MKAGRRSILLPAFFFLFLLPLTAGSIEYRGFRLHRVSDFIDSSAALSLDQIMARLESSGFFRSVDIEFSGNRPIIRVVEYPRVKEVEFRHSTLYAPERLLEGLGIELNQPFNENRYRDSAEELYRAVQQDGYTHWRIREITVHPSGNITVLVDEGRLVRVYESDDRISGSVLKSFFGPLIGRPFHQPTVKYALEELLFTEAFYSIDTRVEHGEKGVSLRLEVDKKSINRLTSNLDYSAVTGVVMNHRFNGLKRGNKLKFLDVEADYYRNSPVTLARIRMTHSDYRVNIGRSAPVFGASLTYVNSGSSKDIYFEWIPGFRLALFDGLSITAVLRSGIHKNYSGENNRLMLAPGLTIEYRYRSDLDRWRILLMAGISRSVLNRYSLATMRFQTRHGFEPLTVSAALWWRRLWGKDYGFNHAIPPMDMGIIWPEGLFLRRSGWVGRADIISRPLWGKIRLGIFGQNFSSETLENLVGIRTVFYYQGLPVEGLVFLRGDRLNLMIRLSLSL